MAALNAQEMLELIRRAHLTLRRSPCFMSSNNRENSSLAAPNLYIGFKFWFYNWNKQDGGIFLWSTHPVYVLNFRAISHLNVNPFINYTANYNS